jgi:hypothetical protein
MKVERRNCVECGSPCTITYPYCPRCLNRIASLAVKKWRNEYGLFTTRPIKKNTILGIYLGENLTFPQFRRKYPDLFGKYTVTVDGRSYIDSAKKRCYAAMANDYRGLAGSKNAAINHSNGSVYLRATRNIPAGSQILTDYGSEYWERTNRPG